MIDKSLHFGLANWFFVAQDETGLVYDYVAYQDKNGSTLIGQYKKDETSALYYVSSGVFATVWAGRLGYTYHLPSALQDPTV